MEGGRAALLAGEIDVAHAAFTQAEGSFREALEETRHPLLRLASFLPILGRTIDTVHAAAEAGQLVAEGARLTTSTLTRLSMAPGGLGSGKGAIPLEHIEKIGRSLERTRSLTARAGEIIRRSESSLILGEVAEARAEFVEELAAADKALLSATALTRELPEFLGAEGTRRYFFGAQSPAELRGTGGLMGAYSILTVRDGRLDFSPFAPVQSLKNLASGDIPPPDPSLFDRYDRFGGSWFWLNTNMTPDFPSAATAIERLYAEVEGEELDGTILADPFALQALVAATGPVEIEGTDIILAPENTVQVLAHDAYAEFTDPATRKLVLGESAKLVFDQFLNVTVPTDPAGAARTLVQTAADGHVLLHSAEPEIQRAFELVGAAGKLRDPKGDYLGVFSNNAAANKADYYLEPRIRYEVRLETDGTATATAAIHLENNAPDSGESPLIIGPFNEDFVPGENKTFLSTYCASSCRLESFEGSRGAEINGSQEELGHPVFSTFADMPSMTSSTLHYSWALPEAWVGDFPVGTYELMYQGQNTIRPTQLEVEIWPPEGASVVAASDGLQVLGDRVVWEGQARHLMRFKVAFSSWWPGSS
jgi:hypothetical protein